MPDFGDVGYDRPGGRYEYEGATNPNEPSVANGQITPEQWAEYQKKRRRDAILGLTGTLGGMFAAGPLAQLAFGGGAAGAASASVPGAVGAAAPPLGAGTVVGGAGGVGAGAGAAGAGIGSQIARTGSDVVQNTQNPGGMSTRDWIALATSLAGIGGGALSSRPNLTPNSQTTDPNMQKLIASMQGRLDQSEPLYKSIMAMANGLLPTQYQNGGAGR